MNVFILNSGRCGSTTFIEACRYIENFSAAHESRIHLLGHDRLAYPDNHIEADNRLCWLTGRLEQRYGPSAWYVWLQRDLDATAKSFARRYDYGIMQAWRQGFLLRDDRPDAMALAHDYLHSLNSNVELFLRDKPHTLAIQLENIEADFPRFWHWIGATGDLDAALRVWQTRYNASE